MTQDIIKSAKALISKAWRALTLAPATLPARPQLAGRRGYGDGGIDLELKEPIMTIARRFARFGHEALMMASLILVGLLIAAPLWR